MLSQLKVLGRGRRRSGDVPAELAKSARPLARRAAGPWVGALRRFRWVPLHGT